MRATLAAPAQVSAGSTVPVGWSGPDNSGDYITIVPAGAPDGQYLGYVYSSAGNPVNLRTPNFPGDYELRYVTLEDGNNIVLNKNGSVLIVDDQGRELENHTVVIGAVISVPDGGKVAKGETFVQWDPYNVPIISEKAGRVQFHDIIENVTMKQVTDETTGQDIHARTASEVFGVPIGVVFQWKAQPSSD